MPERRFTSKQIEELWGLRQADYQRACRARHIDHYCDGKPGAKRPRYSSTARQIEKFFERRLVRSRA